MAQLSPSAARAGHQAMLSGPGSVAAMRVRPGKSETPETWMMFGIWAAMPKVTPSVADRTCATRRVVRAPRTPNSDIARIRPAVVASRPGRGS